MTSRIFLFGNPGLMSVLMPALIACGESIVGLCTRAAPTFASIARRRLGAAVRTVALRSEDAFQLPGPFDDLPSPRRIAKRHGIRVLESTALLTPQFEAALRRLEPDCIVVAGFHRRIPSRVYGSARLAAMNFHPSLLPRHRGGTPLRWTIKRGERLTGLTAHLLSESFDAGDILAQREVEVGERETAGDLEKRIAEELTRFAPDVLAALRANTLAPKPQSGASASYEPAYKGDLLTVDWSESAEEIRRTCYAVRPQTGGRSSYAGRPICVWETHRCAIPGPQGEPGLILGLDDANAPIVRCGDGAVVLTHLVEDARLIESGGSRRHRFRVGEKLT